jgi:hypothetical protein
MALLNGESKAERERKQQTRVLYLDNMYMIGMYLHAWFRWW